MMIIACTSRIIYECFKNGLHLGFMPVRISNGMFLVTVLIMSYIPYVYHVLLESSLFYQLAKEKLASVYQVLQAFSTLSARK